MRWNSILKTTAIFAAAGPLVGLLLIGGLPILWLSLMLGGIPVLAAYVLGLGPAIFTGLLVAIQARTRNVWLYWLTAVGSGALTSAAFAIVVWGAPEAALRIACIGTGAAFVCALIAMGPAGLGPAIPPQVAAMTRGWDASAGFFAAFGAVYVFLACRLGLMIFS
ncbi:hypothetical protein [Brevundimonas sp.]|uniref:hypothetical protein n=1 Tax=Brevundimonas sp. TaxID=1871086 RepID=UPI00391A6ECD